MIARWMGRLRAWLRSMRLDREFDEEVRFHLEMEAAKLQAGGASKEPGNFAVRPRWPLSELTLD